MKTILMDMTNGVDFAMAARAGKILREGGLVAFPTETVYGLGGNALDESASGKIYAAKGRPSDNPLIVHIAGMEALSEITRDLPPEAKALADAFWPGPLTMIFKKDAVVPCATTGGLDTVAVRMPSHPAALALIEAGGGFVAAPSANVSGRPSPTKASHVLQDLDGRIDCVIDGGEVGIGIESTIIDLSEGTPTILRPGFVSLEMAREVIGRVRMDPGVASPDSGQRPKAPGMKYRHYAPNAPMYLAEGAEGAVVLEICRRVRQDVQSGRKCGILASRETEPMYETALCDLLAGHRDRVMIRAVGTRLDEKTVARHLYDELRFFDEAGADVIYSETFTGGQMGEAIMNRLLKAAGHQVIRVERRG